MEAMSAASGMRGVSVTVAITIAALAGCAWTGPERADPPAASSAPPLVIPGGPGEQGRTATPGERPATPGGRPSAADVRFAEGMIPHHRQALEMAALVPDRSTDPRLRALAERITAAQEPEIKVLTAWLAELGRRPPEGHGHAEGAYGMATLEQMNRLRAARGAEFDRLFLTLMITHHQGALTMAKEELAGGTDRRMRLMARDVYSGQSIEINRMTSMLGR
jgi:uncharacterized protein (DUF305 family)